MEFIAFALLGVVWFVSIVGVIRLVRLGRYWTALAAVLLGPFGVFVALYGLLLTPITDTDR